MPQRITVRPRQCLEHVLRRRWLGAPSVTQYVHGNAGYVPSSAPNSWVSGTATPA